MVPDAVSKVYITSELSSRDTGQVDITRAKIAVHDIARQHEYAGGRLMAVAWIRDCRDGSASVSPSYPRVGGHRYHASLFVERCPNYRVPNEKLGDRGQGEKE